MKRAITIIFLIFVFFFVLVRWGSVQIFAVSCGDSCSDPSSCQSVISACNEQISILQNQANTLSNQIAQFNAQIRLTTLKISQTEEKIILLGGRIDQLEVSLTALTKAFTSRAVETYKMAKVGDPFMILISASDLSEAIFRFHYLQKIQEADRDLLQKLQSAQTTYKGEKASQEELQRELEKQKQTLASQKQAKATLLAVTRNDEKKYQNLLTNAKAQLAAFSRFTSSQGGASILSNQTKCDSWGCYYNQRDSQWGNMSLGNTNYSMAQSGCFVTSIAMIASHYNKNIKPNDIAALPDAFTTAADLIHSFSVNGVSVSISSSSKSILDSELSAGRPVIAGLYSGPDHFIVILRKEGSSYIMHDPFFENGGNMRFEDKYNLSEINSLRLVNFN